MYTFPLSVYFMPSMHNFFAIRSQWVILPLGACWKFCCYMFSLGVDLREKNFIYLCGKKENMIDYNIGSTCSFGSLMTKREKEWRI